MRSFKACLLILAFCLAILICISGIAEEEIVSAPVDIEVGEAESIGINGLFSENQKIYIAKYAAQIAERTLCRLTKPADFLSDDITAGFL